MEKFNIRLAVNIKFFDFDYKPPKLVKDKETGELIFESPMPELTVPNNGPDQLRITGNLSKKLLGGTASQTGSINIYNLNPSNRSKLFIDMRAKAKDFETTSSIYQAVCTIFGGYASEVFNIFSGEILVGRSVRQGTEWVTTLQLQAGATVFAQNIATIYRREWADFDIPMTGQIAGIGEKVDSEVPYAEGAQIASWIDKEQIIKAGSSTVFVIDASTGLLKTPIISGDYVLASVMFEPRVQVGQIAEIKSLEYRALNQQYVIGSISHKLDNYGQCVTDLGLFIKIPESSNV